MRRRACCWGRDEGCAVFIWDVFLQKLACVCWAFRLGLEKRRTCCAMRFGGVRSLLTGSFLFSQFCGSVWDALRALLEGTARHVL